MCFSEGQELNVFQHGILPFKWSKDKSCVSYAALIYPSSFCKAKFCQIPGGGVTNSLFCIGALAEGEVHHPLVAPFIISAHAASAHGQVYFQQVGYPLFSSIGDHQIFGTVYELKDSDIFWSVMDEAHGVHLLDPIKSLHHRIRIKIATDSGVSEAWVYEINTLKLGKALLRYEGSNWLEHFKSNPPLTSQLTDSQKHYIKKLAQSSGRDIVKIDISLYRELMKLGLIVDKGRRLALSSLGKEVCRYLDSQHDHL